MSLRSSCSLNLKTSFYHEALKKANGTQSSPEEQSASIPPKEQNVSISLIEQNVGVTRARAKPNIFCSICEKVLTDNLLEHTKSHFQSTTARCEICSKVFNDYEKFRTHAKKHPRLPITYDTSDEEIEETSQVVENPEQKQTKPSKDPDDFNVFEISEKLPWSDLSSESSEDDEDDEKRGNEKKTRIIWPWETPGSTKEVSSGKVCRFCLAFVPFKLYEAHNSGHLKGVFLCDICGVCFLNYKAYQRHNYKHNVNLQCPHCGRRSKNKSNLKCHIAMEHTGEATHTCPICAKKFFNFRHLRNHERRHMNILNFECEVCNKRFFTSHARKSHMRQHTDEKPFQCQCGEAFKHNVSLKAHQKSKHGINEERTVPCSECDRKFGSVTAMLTHLRKHPSDDNPKGKRKRKRKVNELNKEETNESVPSKGKKRKGGQYNGERSEEEQIKV